MSVGAMIYGYRNNFGCKTSNPKKGRKTKIKMFNLIIEGFREVSKYDDDYFVSLAQWLMKKGYPLPLKISENTSSIESFFMDSLFSMSPWHFEYLMINKSGFHLFKWRKQFDLFGEVEIKGLNFYKQRSAIPLDNFTSMRDVYQLIFTRYGKYNSINETLKFSFNKSWPDAIWILSKYCSVTSNKFYYVITYGCKDDYEAKKAKKSFSSWHVTLESNIDENYIDFCLRIFTNYEGIISGEKDVLRKFDYLIDLAR